MKDSSIDQLHLAVETIEFEPIFLPLFADEVERLLESLFGLLLFRTIAEAVSDAVLAGHDGHVVSALFLERGFCMGNAMGLVKFYCQMVVKVASVVQFAFGERVVGLRKGDFVTFPFGLPFAFEAFQEFPSPSGH